jgi:hypothetical protein
VLGQLGGGIGQIITSTLTVNNSVYLATASGNVGIGTLTPNSLYKLDVGGSINFTGMLYQNDSLFQPSRWSAAGPDIYRLSKVGISTGLPQATLDVNGSVKVSGPLTLSGSTLTVTGNAFSVNGSALTVTGGKVGIGTTSPDDKLDVAGGITASSASFITVSDAGLRVSSSAFLASSGGNVGIGNASPLAILGVGMQASYTNNASALIAGSPSLGTALDNMTYMGEFRLTSANTNRLLFLGHRVAAGTDWTTSGWRIQPAVDSSFTGVNGNRGYIEFYMNGTNRLNFSGAGNTIPDMVVTSAGNVGIGATSPGETLEVGGNVKISGSIKGAAPSYFTSPYTSNRSCAGVAGSWVNFDASLIVTGDVGDIFYVFTNGIRPTPGNTGFNHDRLYPSSGATVLIDGQSTFYYTGNGIYPGFYALIQLTSTSSTIYAQHYSNSPGTHIIEAGAGGNAFAPFVITAIKLH